MTVPWDKFDLEHLKANHPKIEDARAAAVKNRKEVMLMLGLYEGKQTLADFIAHYKAELSKTRSFDVPNLSVFAQDDDMANGRFNFKSYNEFGAAEKRSERDYEYYTEFIGEFFLSNNFSFRKQTYSLSYPNSGKQYVVIVDATASPNSAQTTYNRVVDYLRQDRRSDFRNAVILLKANTAHFNSLQELFFAMKQKLETEVIGDETELRKASYQLLKINEMMELLSKTTTLPADFSSDLDRALEDLKLR